MREEHRRLSNQSYPGDLAQDVLDQPPKQGWLTTWRAPILASTALILGLAIGLIIYQPSQTDTTTGPTADVQPTPTMPPVVQDDNPKPISPVQAAKTKLPDIDRDLLPLTRVGQATWLSSPAPQQQQVEKQSRLAQHPNPNKRLRLRLSVPTRHTIERTLTRPLKITTNPKPQRTS